MKSVIQSVVTATQTPVADTVEVAAFTGFTLAELQVLKEQAEIAKLAACDTLDAICEAIENFPSPPAP